MRENRTFQLAAGVGIAALVAVAGCSQAGHGAQAPQPTKQATSATQSAKSALTARTAQQATTGRAAFQAWWADKGYKQYARVASDLEQIVIIDVVQDKDANFTSDSLRLVADAKAAGANPPPVDASGYVTAMRAFERGGQASANGSYGQAYGSVQAGLQEMAAFNTAAGLTASSVPAAK
jgi:hypothetical protein